MSSVGGKRNGRPDEKEMVRQTERESKRERESERKTECRLGVEIERDRKAKESKNGGGGHWRKKYFRVEGMGGWWERGRE